MSPEEAADMLIEDLREHIRARAEDAARFVATGEEPVVADPFTGRQVTLPASAALRRLADVVKERGLGQDEAFRSVLRGAFVELGVSALFHLFAALDGEGELAMGGVELELRVRGGKPLPGFLHEKFPALEE